MRPAAAFLACFAVLTLIALPSTAAETLAAEPSVEKLIEAAGNAASDAERLGILRRLAKHPGLEPAIAEDAATLAGVIEEWLTNERLEYFGGQIYRHGHYGLGVEEDSPLYPIALLYKARMHFWVGVEYGGIWSHSDKRREHFDKVRAMFEEVQRAFPRNPIVAMYLGTAIPPDKVYEAPGNAPAWAVHQREGLERLADIVEWWIDNRLQESGAYGGGWGDDCEMWRWWTPVLIAFRDEKIERGQATFSRALMSQPHMRKGYTDHLTDVEHSAEDSSDALTPMMHIEPDNPEWSRMALKHADIMEHVWTGVNDRGFLQFKSINISADRVSDDPAIACGTVYHVKAVQPLLLYWQRTRDERLTRLFSRWMDTWVDAAAREERGKPAGIVPSAIHWPEGYAGGVHENWWQPRGEHRDPLYVWPSYMRPMLSTLLLTYHVTGNAKYLRPIESMAELRLRYLDERAETLEPGSAMWCAARLGSLGQVAAKRWMLEGDAGSLAPLLDAGAGPYAACRLNGERDKLERALVQNAAALRVNFPGYTSEVRYTDRVLRFPAVMMANGMYQDAVPGFHLPKPDLLYATATGDMGDAGYFPLNAVRWLTRPRDIAALVTVSGKGRFEAELFHFGGEGRPMAAELYLLEDGTYTLTLTNGDTSSTQEFNAAGGRTRVSFALPPRTLCTLRVQPAGL